MVLERGTLLNKRYRIVEILGQGGMGSVYRAIDENLGVEVAVKDNLFTTEEYARQFRREAIILANLRHPNLPRVTDHFVIEEEGQYLVMDYIEGEDLRQRMDRVGVLPEDEVITIGAAVCDALTYLASRRPSIIHRDIKPGNVKITPQGSIFLVDFGLAKTLQGSQATTTGARAMTPGFSPPEQYGTARTDHRTDIFSLGATLYSALTGDVPEDALARAMDQADLTSIRKHNSRISRRLASVIEKALEVRPDDRYQSGEEFKQALLSASSGSRRKNGEYVVAPPPDEERAIPGDGALLPDEAEEKLPRSSPQLFPISAPLEDFNNRPRSRPRKRGRRIGCWVILILMAVIIGGGSLAFINDPDLPAQVIAIAWPLLFEPVATATETQEAAIIEITVTPTSIPTDIPTDIILTNTLQPSPTATLTPTSTDEPTPTPTITSTPTITPLPTLMGGGSGLIAYASDSNGIPQIYTINVDGTGSTQVTDIGGGACQPNWAPDGMRLVFISPCTVEKSYYPDSSMFIINADGTGLVPLPTVSNGDYDPAWSPDGKYIAFTSLRSSGRPQIHLMALEDYSVTLLSEAYGSDMQPSWSPDGKLIVFVSTLQGDQAQMWIMDADGQNQERYSKQNLVNTRPSWSPDYKTILFTQMAGLNGVPSLMVAPYPYDVYIENRISHDSMPMRDGVYSPDGYWIAFNGWLAGSNHDIYIMASNGAGIQQVTTDTRTDFDPAWMPVIFPQPQDQ